MSHTQIAYLQLEKTKKTNLEFPSNHRYQKTTETVKLAAEKTTDIFGSLGDSIGRKLVDVKNSTAFKSIEERVGSTISKAGLSSANTSGSSNNNNNNIITSNIRSPDEAVNNLKNEKE